MQLKESFHCDSSSCYGDSSTGIPNDVKIDITTVIRVQDKWGFLTTSNDWDYLQFDPSLNIKFNTPL
jgi:hypothetical protein